MKTQELLKLLKKNNCEIVRNGSRHDMWFSPLTQKQFAVPRHKAEIPIGTLNNSKRSIVGIPTSNSRS